MILRILSLKHSKIIFEFLLPAYLILLILLAEEMATFDWIPYLEGKLMTYYEIIALIFSIIALLFAFISYMVYLLLSKYSILPAIKDSAFKHIFTFLSSIPLICAALDVLYLIEGIIGMAAVLILGAILENGRQKWNPSTNASSPS